MSDTVISVENLSKYYRLGTIGSSTLRDDVDRLWARVRGKPDPLSKIGHSSLDVHHSSNGHSQETNDKGQTTNKTQPSDSIWALRDVSFEVKQGEVVGIIGRNGAGKSTLLKILSRITAPTSGVVKVKGRIASLLEVGTGFHPELTGRENIFLNGAILGMRRAEIEKKFDEIVAFAEVEKFIDTPVKRYSSGMYVRLAFAVAAHLEPEILLVDEVLAVGDAAFQKKCLGKMGDVAREGRTVLFVSHNMHAILRLCQSVVWLQNGFVAKIGPSESICIEYLAYHTEKGGARHEFLDYGEHSVIFTEMEMRNSAGELTNIFRADEPIQFCIIYRVLKPVNGLTLGLNITDGLGGSLWAANELDQHPNLFDRVREPGDYKLIITAPGNVLRPGTYQVALGAASGGHYHHHPQDFPSFDVTTVGYWRQSHHFFGLSGGPVAVPMDVQVPVRIDGRLQRYS